VHGVTVGDAVIDDEAAFRQREEALVLEALRTAGAIVAVGSGALSEPVLEALRTLPVVWLEVGLVDAVRRSGLSGMRPVALGNVRAQIGDMLAERAPMYVSVADLTVSTDARMVTSVAEEIEDWERTR
jgi:shikimate kinase